MFSFRPKSLTEVQLCESNEVGPQALFSHVRVIIPVIAGIMKNFRYTHRGVIVRPRCFGEGTGKRARVPLQGPTTFLTPKTVFKHSSHLDRMAEKEQ